MSRALSTWASVPPISLGEQGGDVAVPAVLAQHVGCVPEPGHGLLGHRERAEPGVHDPSLGRGAGRGLGEQLGGAREPGSLDEVAEDPPQRRDAALLTRGVRRLGCGRVPDLGDVAGHLTVGEVVERRVDHLGRDPAERRGASSEVAVPVVAEAERRHRVVRLRGEEVDQRDRLGELEESAGDGLGMRHLCHLLWSWRRPRGRPLTSATNTSSATRHIAGNFLYFGRNGGHTALTLNRPTRPGTAAYDRINRCPSGAWREHSSEQSQHGSVP